MGAVGLADLVAPWPSGLQPAALEQRADDIAAVAEHVHGSSLGVRPERRPEHEAHLWCLLDTAQMRDQAEAPDPREDQLQPRGRILLGELSELRDRRLDRAGLPQVDETRLFPEDSRQEGRSRARTPDDEHVPAARLASGKADLAPSAHDESRSGAAVERRGVDGLHDHNLLTRDR